LMAGFSSLLDISPDITGLTPIEFSMSLWSYARMRSPRSDTHVIEDVKMKQPDSATSKLVDKAAKFMIRFPKFVQKFDPQQVSNTSWSLSRVGCENTTAYNLLADRAIESLSSFNSVNVSMLAYSFVRIPHVQLYKALASSDACSYYRILGASITGKIVSNLLWAYANLPEEVFKSSPEMIQHRNNVFATCISVATARQNIWTYKPGQVVVIARSLGCAKPAIAPPEAFLQTLGEVIAKRHDEFRPEEIVAINAILHQCTPRPGLSAPMWLLVLVLSIFLFFFRF